MLFWSIPLRFFHTGAWLIVSALLIVSATAAGADNTPPDVSKESQPLTPIRLFQKFVSPADGDRCPMHPSCSSYASRAVSRHGIIKGWVLTCDRLLRCGRDETRLSPPIRVESSRLTYDPLRANTFWWDNR